MTGDLRTRRRRFRAAYAEHRACEGRRMTLSELLQLPWLRDGPLASQWRVRACTFDCFVAKVLQPLATDAAPRPLTLLDLGAGNGWLSYRAAGLGHRALAFDVRTDAVDGLRAAAFYSLRLSRPLERAAAAFEELPLAASIADVAVFNAALHYACDLPMALREAARVTKRGGRIVILDSPFYDRVADGEAMRAEKVRTAAAAFGDRAPDLMGLPFVEFLTPERLRAASAPLGLEWRRHRVRYPLGYELRPLVAAVRRRRVPSRFDVWEGILS